MNKTQRLREKLGEEFVAPTRFMSDGFMLRKITAADAELDYAAIMSSIDHLKATPTPPRCGDWPPEDLTLDHDRRDLAKHEEEFDQGFGYTYTALNKACDKCLGCVYIYPTDYLGFDAEVYLWVTKEEYDKGAEDVLKNLVKDWLKSDWPFKHVIFPCRKDKT